MKATIEKRDGQIKELVNADKENRHSRHFGNEVSRYCRSLRFLVIWVDFGRIVWMLDFDLRLEEECFNGDTSFLDLC